MECLMKVAVYAFECWLLFCNGQQNIVTLCCWIIAIACYLRKLWGFIGTWTCHKGCGGTV